LDIEGGVPRALTREGSLGFIVTPDGHDVLARDLKRQLWFYPVAGGSPRKLDFSPTTDEVIIGLSGEGTHLLVATRGVPLKIDRVEIATKRREPWKEIAPADLAGVQGIPIVRFSADGKAYAYSTLRVLSDLYVVDGLK
jgi:hypothetical protein